MLSYVFRSTSISKRTNVHGLRRCFAFADSRVEQGRCAHVEANLVPVCLPAIRSTESDELRVFHASARIYLRHALVALDGTICRSSPQALHRMSCEDGALIQVRISALRMPGD